MELAKEDALLMVPEKAGAKRIERRSVVVSPAERPTGSCCSLSSAKVRVSRWDFAIYVASCRREYIVLTIHKLRCSTRRHVISIQSQNPRVSLRWRNIKRIQDMLTMSSRIVAGIELLSLITPANTSSP